MKFLTVLFFCVLAFDSYGKILPFQKSKSLEKKVEAIMNQLTDADKVSLLFVVPFYDLETIDSILPGGLILHSKVGGGISAKDLIHKVDQYQKRSLKKYGVRAFVLTDSEGGTVSRLSNKRHRPFKGSLYYDLVTPYMMTQTGDLRLVTGVGKAVGRVLYSLGINMNVAPVVDLASPYKKSYISERVFGSDPYVVQKFSQAYNEGLYQSGVIGVFKHFPGYGDQKVDTHTSTFVSSLSKKQLLESHIVPYLPLGGKGNPQALLTNIGLYTDLDSENTAPLSSKIIQGLIRKDLNFKGLVLTDALNMDGFREKNFSQRVVKSFVAGNDLTLVYGFSFKQAKDSHQAVLKALETGVVSRETLNESVRRVLLFKLRLSSEDKPLEKRLLDYDQRLSELYEVNQNVIRTYLNHFFDKNLHLKMILTTDLNVGVFGSKLFYDNFKKSLSVFKSSTFLNKSFLQNQGEKNHILNQLKQKNYVTFCYGNSIRRCRGLDPAIKKRMIVIQTKPYASLKKEEYLAVIPVYGPALEVGPLILEKLLRVQ